MYETRAAHSPRGNALASKLGTFATGDRFWRAESEPAVKERVAGTFSGPPSPPLDKLTMITKPVVSVSMGIPLGVISGGQPFNHYLTRLRAATPTLKRVYR